MRCILLSSMAATVLAAVPVLATPTFAPFVSYPASPFARELRIADLNRDANPDVVVGTIDDSENVTVYFNDRNGGFSTLPPFLDVYPMSGDVRDIQFGDFDDDGDVDVVVAWGDWSGGVTALANLGDGTLVPATTHFQETRTIAAGFWNVDGTGLADIAVLSFQPSDLLRTYVDDNGHGTWEPGPTSFCGAEVDWATAFGDVSGDGVADIVTIVHGSGHTFYATLVATEEGLPSDFILTLAESGSAEALAIGDLDGDGRGEVVASYAGTTNHVSIHRVTASGHLELATTIAMDGPQDLAIGDLDRDGLPDLAIERYRVGQIEIWRNLGNMEFEFATALEADVVHAIGDINGDLVNDLITTGSGELRIAINTTLGPADVAPAQAGLALAIAPNPVRSAPSRIQLEMPHAGRARVGVLDLAGRMVRTVHEGDLPAGRSSFAWDGADSHGAALAPGVYVLRAETPAGSRAVRIARVP
jgi:hypothetical protein